MEFVPGETVRKELGTTVLLLLMGHLRLERLIYLSPHFIHGGDQTCVFPQLVTLNIRRNTIFSSHKQTKTCIMLLYFLPFTHTRIRDLE